MHAFDMLVHGCLFQAGSLQRVCIKGQLVIKELLEVE